MTDELDGEYSGFSALSKQYKADPTIRNYLMRTPPRARAR